MFTEEEKQLLSKYVTSTESNVYAITGMPGMVGAAYARYSRAKGGFRETLLKEFIKEGNIDPKHADQLIERILIAYGDDSVGELEGAHVSFELVSMLAAKEIEDRRIGGSPIEQSTRYVLYDQKNEKGEWLYYRGREMINASWGPQYIETMDFVFQTYSSLIDPLKKHLEALKPISDAEYDVNGDGEKEKLSELTDEKQIKAFKQTYMFDLRAKACDILRPLLPIGTLTNVGMFGNGRFYQGLLSYLWTTDLPENNTIADKANAALKKVIPQYVRRAKRLDFNAKVRGDMEKLGLELFRNDAPETYTKPSFALMGNGGHIVEKFVKDGRGANAGLEEVADIATIAAMLYPFTNKPLDYIQKHVYEMHPNVRRRIIETYTGKRATRRDRPGRALEDGYRYTFDLVTDFGVYKDLQRHRMNTQQRQLFTTRLGFHMPPELSEINATTRVQECVDKINTVYELMAKDSPLLAQYVVLHGHFIRWTIGMNDREAMHLLELRSTPQGHPGYRVAAQEMHKLIRAKNKWRGDTMNFVDHNDYYWSRADSEAKQRVKEAKLEEKLGTKKQ